MAGKKLAPELMRAVVDALRSGMNPRQAGEAGLSIRQVAARLGRSASTIGRELARNADPSPAATRSQPRRLITKDLRTYAIRILHEDKSLRDHGAER